VIYKKPYTLKEATKVLEHYCAYQERCHKEVKEKLQNMHMIPEVIDTIMVHLIEHNFLNEERFAKAFVSGKFRIKKWGKHRLTQELKRKEISPVIIRKSLAEIDESVYLETFNDLAQKRVETIKETNKLKKRKKFVNYFLYRGWESHLVYEKANTLIK